MNPITHYLDLIVEDIGDLITALGAKELQTTWPVHTTKITGRTRDFEKEVSRLPVDLRDALIELRDNLAIFQSRLSIFKTDFVQARKKCKEIAIQPFRNALIEAGWTKFKNFPLLVKRAA